MQNVTIVESSITYGELEGLLNDLLLNLIIWSNLGSNSKNWYPLKNIFDFTTAGDWDSVAAVERLPALHYSVDFIFLSFEIMGFIVELWNY